MSYKIKSVPKLHDAGKDVMYLQLELKELGFYDGFVDGIFGNKTKKAVSNFQKENGFAGSGIIGPKTLALLHLDLVAINPITEIESITKDLKGKQDRKLHPSIRLMLEAKLFPNGTISEAWKNADIKKCFIEAHYALAKLSIHEKGKNNYGLEVGQVQGTTGSYTEGGNGDAWCEDYQQIVIAIIEDYFQKESPIIGSAHCMTVLSAAKKVPGLVSEKFELATMVLAQHGSSSSGHAMSALKELDDDDMDSNEGNTSIKSLRDGDGSGIKIRNKYINGDLTTRGFVRVYPFNKLPA